MRTHTRRGADQRTVGFNPRSSGDRDRLRALRHPAALRIWNGAYDSDGRWSDARAVALAASILRTGLFVEEANVGTRGRGAGLRGRYGLTRAPNHRTPARDDATHKRGSPAMPRSCVYAWPRSPNRGRFRAAAATPAAGQRLFRTRARPCPRPAPPRPHQVDRLVAHDDAAPNRSPQPTAQRTPTYASVVPPRAGRCRSSRIGRSVRRLICYAALLRVLPRKTRSTATRAGAAASLSAAAHHAAGAAASVQRRCRCAWRVLQAEDRAAHRVSVAGPRTLRIWHAAACAAARDSVDGYAADIVRRVRRMCASHCAG
eukprot:1809247-Prymnesium_polylepis.2